MAEKCYKPTRLVITYNSRFRETTAIELYVGQSTISFIRIIANA